MMRHRKEGMMGPYKWVKVNKKVTTKDVKSMFNLKEG